MEFVCSFCRQSIRLQNGGSAFIYSQIVRHLNGCGSKPPKIKMPQLVVIASEITNKVVGW
jgi:hypothetical protein